MDLGARPLRSDPGVPVSLEDLWPPNLGDAVTDAAVEEAFGYLEDHPRTCKWLVTPIYKPFRPFIRGITPVRGLTNHGY